MEIQSLHQVAISVKDLDASIDFYRNILGAEFIARFDPPGLAFFRIGDTRLLLEGAGGKSVIYLKVSDIDAAHRELLEKGVAFDAGPHPIHRDDDGIFGPAGYEEWMAFFRDPADNVIAIAVQKP